MKVFANGCSFTFGGGLNMYDNQYTDDAMEKHWLDGFSKHPVNQERLSITYPARLAEMLGAESYVNLSRGGASNSRIVRTTLEYFLNALEQGEDLTNYLALVQWSDLSRKEYFIDGHWTVTGVNFAYQEYNDGHHVSDLDQRTNLYYKKLHSDRQDLTDFISQVTALGGFFEKMKIPYLFYTHVNSVDIILSQYLESDKFDDIKVRLQQVDQLYPWLENSYLGSEMLRFNLDPCSVDPFDSHPSRLGNQQFAKILHNWIIKNEIVR